MCGEYKPNESFSGSGHAAHICKKCATLPAAQQAEPDWLLYNKPLRVYATGSNW